MMRSLKIWAIASAFALIAPAVAGAVTSDTIGFHADLNTQINIDNNDPWATLAVNNLSSLSSIESIVVELSTARAAVFAEYDSAYYSSTEPSLEIGEYKTDDVTYSAFATDTWQTVGFVGMQVSDNNKVATFKFSDFDANEAWGISFGLINPKESDMQADGMDLDFTKITVFFVDPDGTLFSTYAEIGNSHSGKVSFPIAATSTVPVPPAAWLLGASMLGIVGLRRKLNS